MIFCDIKNILVAVAHPDDEILGCGGTLARLCAPEKGARATLLFLGEGPTARSDARTSRAPEIRSEARTSAFAAAAAIGVHDLRFAGLPDNRFDTLPLLDIAKEIEAVGREIRPDLVLTHHVGDLNIDHVLTHRAAMTAFRPLPGEKSPLILSFEVLSSTEYSTLGMGTSFHPNFYVDISDFLDAKQSALRAYASEMRPWPHPRSHEGVEHLARLRGSQCGRQAAEAFMLCRSVL
jgi:LmbE family N-acetylglucosaminyl deacetylase